MLMDKGDEKKMIRHKSSIEVKTHGKGVSKMSNPTFLDLAMC